MTDAILSGPDQKEALSLVYARAVAARAGYTTASSDFDRDGVDLRIEAGGAMRPALELQLKATVNLGTPKNGHMHFALKRRNYDLLTVETQTPRLLMVLDLPVDENQWVTIHPNSLVLKKVRLLAESSRSRRNIQCDVDNRQDPNDQSVRCRESVRVDGEVENREDRVKATIQDVQALTAVSPASLSAYARSLGWTRAEEYGDHSDVYAAAGLPEIILPRTQHLGDYASIVSRLIEVLSTVTDTDTLAVYRNLITADRDVIRVRAPTQGGGGAIAVNAGIELVSGARDMLLAAACSLTKPKPLYRAGANKEASEYLGRVNLGQTEQGSFVITLLSPAIAPPIQKTFLPEEVDIDPTERQITRRLAEALSATRDATERTVAGKADAFSEAIASGVSANLCEALVSLIEPFPTLDVSISWARTYPGTTAYQLVRFASDDTSILREAARSFRAREPKADTQLFGIVWKLTRKQQEMEGTITMRATIDDKAQSVTAVLNQSDYHRAIQAHDAKSAVIAVGDLERVGQRWQLLNPRIDDVIAHDDESDEPGGSGTQQ